jgi:hypothetical protein
MSDMFWLRLSLFYLASDPASVILFYSCQPFCFGSTFICFLGLLAWMPSERLCVNVDAPLLFGKLCTRKVHCMLDAVQHFLLIILSVQSTAYSPKMRFSVTFFNTNCNFITINYITNNLSNQNRAKFINFIVWLILPIFHQINNIFKSSRHPKS